MIKSALQSSLTNDIKYRSMSAGAVPSNEYLIATTVLTQNEPSVTFDVSALNGVDKHLKIVMTARSTRAATNSDAYLKFNDDTGSNYTQHYMRGDGSVMESAALQTGAANGIRMYQVATAATNTSNSFAATVLDILDPFNSSKNTTAKFLSGFTGSINRVLLESGSWMNTAALTSISITEYYGSSFTIGSRFSLYGVTA